MNAGIDLIPHIRAALPMPLVQRDVARDLGGSLAFWCDQYGGWCAYAPSCDERPPIRRTWWFFSSLSSL